MFNTGIAALTAYLKKAGHDISLIQVVDEFNKDDYEGKLQSIQPDLIAFSSMSFQWNMTQQMLRSAKRVLPEVPTIVGGCHPTFCPEEVLSCPYVDFICCGEGELALSLFVDALEKKREADLYTIPGI
jgi:radical SAM superfamily enzyme YgiQ (UPF0313 family)